MTLENKLGITDSSELAQTEERISKEAALCLYDSGLLDTLTPGTYASLAEIHRVLFEEIYDFAGQIRHVNLAKGNFRFAPVMYLEAALEKIEQMPQSSFDEIVEKYVEMDVAQPDPRYRDQASPARRSDRSNQRPHSLHEKHRPQLRIRGL